MLPNHKCFICAWPQSPTRVFERFQNLNIVPRRVLADWATTGILHVEVHVSGVSETMLNLIAMKLGQAPSILDTHWHR